jgi:hypothetical protein
MHHNLRIRPGKRPQRRPSRVDWTHLRYFVSMGSRWRHDCQATVKDSKVAIPPASSVAT